MHAPTASAKLPYSLSESARPLAELAARLVGHREPFLTKVGLPAEQVFKTLVARGDRNGVCLAVIPGNALLDLKALAAAAGDRKCDTVALNEVQPLTGYIRGGVTALACKRDYPVWIDETAQLFDVISISAGQRGLQVLLAPEDYRRAVSGQYAAIAKDK